MYDGKIIMKKFSKNQKLNSVLTAIYKQLQDFGIDEIKRYKTEFKNEPDYNIVQYGNLLIYYVDIQELYKKAGYKTKFSDAKIWDIYKRQVGYIVRIITKEN